MKSTELTRKLIGILLTPNSYLLRFVPLPVIVLGLLSSSREAGRAAPLTSPPRVLILDETVYGGAGSQEAASAANSSTPPVARNVSGSMLVTPYSLLAMK